MTHVQELVKEQLFPENSKGGWDSSKIAHFNNQISDNLSIKGSAEVGKSSNRPQVYASVWAKRNVKGYNMLESTLTFLDSTEFRRNLRQRFSNVNAITFGYYVDEKESHLYNGWSVVYSLTDSEISKGPNSYVKAAKKLTDNFIDALNDFDETRWVADAIQENI